MERLIVGFHRDDEGDWVAELACGHRQHVRHRPPFEERSWVVDAGGRRSRVGTPVDCRLCDRAELPATARSVRSTPTWDAATMPERLGRDHRLGPTTWALLVVEEGALRFEAPALGEPPPLERKVVPGIPQVVPPAAVHHVEPLGEVRFHLELFQVEPARAAGAAGRDEP